MKEEALIKKWLDKQLTEEELNEFQQLEAYDSYVKISENAKFFKAPSYNSTQAYKELQSIIERRKTRVSFKQRLKPMAKIAAIFVIGFGIYALFNFNKLTTIDTMAGQNIKVVLPDASVAQLNSLSHLSYNKRKWNDNREVKLEGEAFFKVKKGSQFDVHTSFGIITVLGTEFNVKNRNNYFEVKCFEGKVRVSSDDQQVDLPAGKSLRIVNGVVSENKTDLNHPTWIDSFSSFKSVPFSEVLNEFERQYNVKISADLDTSTLFTGMFVHNNQELALKSIALPLNLEYSIKNKHITLRKFE